MFTGGGGVTLYTIKDTMSHIWIESLDPEFCKIVYPATVVWNFHIYGAKITGNAFASQMADIRNFKFTTKITAPRFLNATLFPARNFQPYSFHAIFEISTPLKGSSNYVSMVNETASLVKKSNCSLKTM